MRLRSGGRTCRPGAGKLTISDFGLRTIKNLRSTRSLIASLAAAPIMKAAAAPVGQPWLWTLAFGQHEDRTPTHGYEPTREAAMAAFAKSWRRHGKATTETQRTGPSDFVLNRDRR